MQCPRHTKQTQNYTNQVSPVHPKCTSFVRDIQNRLTHFQVSEHIPRHQFLESFVKDFRMVLNG